MAGESKTETVRAKREREQAQALLSAKLLGLNSGKPIPFDTDYIPEKRRHSGKRGRSSATVLELF
jgi:hypothetical protein